MKKILILVVAFALCVVLLNFLPVHGEEAVYENVVRLHVIANSDDDGDQALKLKVRDALLEKMPEILGNSSSRADALECISENLALIRETAEKTVAENGFDYPVSVSLGREFYPTKSYEAVCFPSGVYESLQVKIGDADGKNWWCVLFPRLCLAPASKKNAEEAFVQVGLTSEQYRIITETEDTKYKLRFKFLELFNSVSE